MLLIYVQIIGIIILRGCSGEPPTSSCIKPKPFKNRFGNCLNFSEICYKTEDIDCNNLLSSCQDCPTSNITILFLQDIFKSNAEMKVKIDIFDAKAAQSKSEIERLSKKIDEINKYDKQSFIISIFILILCLVLISSLIYVILLQRNSSKTVKRPTQLAELHTLVDESGVRNESNYSDKNIIAEINQLKTALDKIKESLDQFVNESSDGKSKNINDSIAKSVADKVVEKLESKYGRVLGNLGKTTDSFKNEILGEVLDKFDIKIPKKDPDPDDDKFMSLAY